VAQEQAIVREELLEYCKMDTLGMVRLLDCLLRVVAPTGLN